MRTFLCLAVSTLALAASASGASTAKPHVALAGLSPVVVVGSGFQPATPVHVELVAGGVRLERSVVATAAGSFAARWTRTLHVRGCARVRLVAYGGGVSVSAAPYATRKCASFVPLDPGP